MTKSNLRSHVLFQGDDCLEGMLEMPPGRRPLGGVVIACSHPLFGGTMADPMVVNIARACLDRGITTLRFNYREVGKSRGHYSGPDEFRDVEAAMAFLREQLDGLDGETQLPLGLAGYSFGCIQSARAAGRASLPVRALAMVAFVPPRVEDGVGNLEQFGLFKGPVLEIAAEHDDWSEVANVERILRESGMQYTMHVIRGANHSFDRHKAEVAGLVATFLEDCFRT
jgi:uncharacterized protein